MTAKLTMTGLAQAIKANTAATRAHVEDCADLRTANTKAMLDLKTTVDATARIVGGHQRTVEGISRLIRWGGGIVFTAVVTGAVGLYFQNTQAHDQTIATATTLARYTAADAARDRAEQQAVNHQILEELKHLVKPPNAPRRR